jgi:hypothetical protein
LPGETKENYETTQSKTAGVQAEIRNLHLYDKSLERHYSTMVLGTASLLPRSYKFIIHHNFLYRRYTTYAAEKDYLSKPIR